MRFLSLILIATVICAAESQVDKVLAASVQKARVEMVQISKDACRDLDRVKREAMRHGDLDTANAADKAIKDLQDGKLADLVAAKEQANTNLLGDAPAPSPVGTWKVIFPSGAMKCFLTIEKNGVDANGGGILGTMKDGTISWANGTAWKIVNEDGKWYALIPEGKCKLEK